MTSDPRAIGPIGILAPIELAELRDYLFASDAERISPQIAGGSPIHLLCKALLARGHRLVLFSLHSSVAGMQILEGERLRVYLGPIKATSVLNAFRDERRSLAGAIRREAPACLHAHWTYEYALAAIDAGLPHVVTAHDAPLACLRWNLVNPFGRQSEANLYRAVRNDIFWLARTAVAYEAARAARRLTAVSPYVAEHLRRFGFHHRPIAVIPNGMPTEFLARRRQRSRGDAFTFATALGVWGRLKNGVAAIAAFAQVRRALPGARMMMFGGGYGADGPAAAWAHERGWQDGIDFRGHVPHREIIEILADRVDVLVHPSHVEAHPMPLIEAMALGIPAIGGVAAGGVPWTLGEGSCGVLVDIDSPGAIAAAMLRLAQDEALRSRLGDAGRESVRRRFHIEHVADRYEAIYMRLTSRGSQQL